MRVARTLCAAAVCFGCSASGDPVVTTALPRPLPVTAPKAAPKETLGPLSVDEPFAGPPRPLPSDARISELTPSINLFARELYGAVPRTGNFVLSPASVAFSLGMESLGARGATREEFDRVLHREDSGLTSDSWHEAMGGLRRRWLHLHAPKHRTDAPLSVADQEFLVTYKAAFEQGAFDIEEPNLQTRVVPANAVFTPRPDLIADSYAAEVERHYGANVFTLDSKHPNAQIDAWVRDATYGRLPAIDVTLDDDLDVVTVLASALYFQGQWLNPFEPSNTRDDTFYVDGERRAEVPTIHDEDRSVSVGETETYAVVSMTMTPFEMILVIPKARGGLEVAEAAFIDGTVFDVPLEDRTVDFSMPKFAIRPESLELRGPLEALGLRRVFDEGSSDLGGMLVPSAPFPAVLSAVSHAATIEVDEEGVVAAAAVVATDVWGGLVSPRGGVVHIDRPFVFLVRERGFKKADGAILFAGRVTDPR